MAMGYLHSAHGAFNTEDFTPALEMLRDVTAWTSGTWDFGEGNQRPWNGLQFVPRDYMELSQYLLSHLKSARSATGLVS